MHLYLLQLQEIALGRSHSGAYISNIDHFCASERRVITNSIGTYTLDRFGVLAGIGFLFQVLFISLISANVGLQVSTYISHKAADYSFDGYGMFWGISTSAFLFTIYLCTNDFDLIVTIFKSHGATSGIPYFMLLVIIFILLTSLLVVVYIFWKNRPRLTVPWMCSFAIRLLSCGSCRKNWAEAIAVGVAWWFNLVALQWFLCHGVFILLAVLASPTSVPLNVMALVLLFVCTTYTSALLYTIFAYVCTSPSKRKKEGGTVAVRAAILVPLLVTIICYVSLMVACGHMINTATKQNYYPSLITSAVASVVIGLVTVGLKWFITAWFEWSPNNTAHVQHRDEDGEKVYHIVLDDMMTMD